MIVGLESNSKIFTVSVHGLLELQVSNTLTDRSDCVGVRSVTQLWLCLFPSQTGQYTSIFVDNAAGASITIQNGSDFMGMLLGV